MRDKYSQQVEDNLLAILASQGMNPNTVKKTMKADRGSASTSIYDFLVGKTNSPRVNTLGTWADALNVPISVFLMPPDRRDAVTGLLRILDSDADIDADLAGELVAELLRASTEAARDRSRGESDRSANE